MSLSVKVSETLGCIQSDQVKESQTFGPDESMVVGQWLQNAHTVINGACRLGSAKLSIWPNQSGSKSVQNGPSGRIGSCLSKNIQQLPTRQNGDYPSKVPKPQCPNRSLSVRSEESLSLDESGSLGHGIPNCLAIRVVISRSTFPKRSERGIGRYP